METAAGLALLAVYLATFVPLLRLLRSPRRPAWLRRELNVEYVLLAHIALLLAGGALTIDALVT